MVTGQQTPQSPDAYDSTIDLSTPVRESAGFAAALSSYSLEELAHAHTH